MVTTSPVFVASSKLSQAFFNAALPSAVILSQASSAQSASRARLTSSTSCRLFSVICATSAPRLGIMVTRPSSSSFRMASRIGVRLTPRRFARWISISLSPGFSSPVRIARRSVLNTTSRSGRNSSILTVKSCSIRFPLVRAVYCRKTPSQRQPPPVPLS